MPDILMDKPADRKIFNDSVHGTISMHPLLVKIIDMPEFQRLRNIKQLGGVYRLYPAACHNRFEHSIGVCHLAGLFIEKLRAKQPATVKVTDEEVLCVQIAGLCHDIGHGPFSHLFDKEFAVLCKKEGHAVVKHEEMSVKILKYLYDTTNVTTDKGGPLKVAFDEYGLQYKHLELICDLIYHEKDKFKDNERAYLYQIVASDNGLDVDRWDYFARDSLQLGLKYAFDHMRCMEMARVIDRNICYRDKEAVNIYNMFYTRFSLYRCAYYHPVSSAVQHMIAEALYMAKDYLTFSGERRQTFPLHKIHQDVVAYLKATDHVYYEILYWKDESTGGDMDKARDLIRRVERHEFYHEVWNVKSPRHYSETSLLDGTLEKQLDEWFNTEDIKPRFLYAKVVDIGFGGKGKNPLDDVSFFKKDKNPTSPCPMESDKLPEPIASMESKDIRLQIFSKLSRKQYAERFDEAERATFIKLLEAKLLTFQDPKNLLQQM